MKKLATSVSPFIMMIIPVLLMVAVSVSFVDNDKSTSEGLSTTTITKSATETIVKTGQQSIVRFLLK